MFLMLRNEKYLIIVMTYDDDENLKYMATMSILITILIQSYNVPCNNIKTVICIYLTNFLSVMQPGKCIAVKDK